MSRKQPTPLADYAGLLSEIKIRIRQSQARAILAVPRALPQDLQSSLPSIETIEAELAEAPPEHSAPKLLPDTKRKGGQP